jgi:uncharacterized protein (TIGR02996 family)
MTTSLSIDPELQPNEVVRGFCQSILEFPADDTPRVVLADWLDEHGDAVDAARAEFLRLQCALARFKGDSAHFQQLHIRQADLLRRYRQAWVEADNPDFGLDGHDNHARFVRGLPVFSCVNKRLAKALNQAQKSVDKVPLDEHYLDGVECALLTCGHSR